MKKFYSLLAALTLGACAHASAAWITPILMNNAAIQQANMAATQRSVNTATQHNLHAQQARMQSSRATRTHDAFYDCPQFFAASTSPAVPQSEHWQLRALCYDAFAVLHSGLTKTPLFVAERLNHAHLTDALDEKRTNKFFADARLPRLERAQLDDYKGSGFDRGHMAPAADMPTAQAMAQSFSLANMVPQAPENNRKAWAGIEKATRKYAMRAKGNVYVITGPVFAGETSYIGKGGVGVPSHLFKLVYDETTQRAWAHWMENTDTARASRPISYHELVKRTGIEFLPGVAVKD